METRDERVMTASVSLVFSAYLFLAAIVTAALILLNLNNIQSDKIQANKNNANGKADSTRTGIVSGPGKLTKK